MLDPFCCEVKNSGNLQKRNIEMHCMLWPTTKKTDTAKPFGGCLGSWHNQHCLSDVQQSLLSTKVEICSIGSKQNEPRTADFCQGSSSKVTADFCHGVHMSASRCHVTVWQWTSRQHNNMGWSVLQIQQWVKQMQSRQCNQFSCCPNGETALLFVFPFCAFWLSLLALIDLIFKFACFSWQTSIKPIFIWSLWQNCQWQRTQNVSCVWTMVLPSTMMAKVQQDQTWPIGLMTEMTAATLNLEWNETETTARNHASWHQWQHKRHWKHRTSPEQCSSS